MAYGMLEIIQICSSHSISYNTKHSSETNLDTYKTQEAMLSQCLAFIMARRQQKNLRDQHASELVSRVIDDLEQVFRHPATPGNQHLLHMVRVLQMRQQVLHMMRVRIYVGHGGLVRGQINIVQGLQGGVQILSVAQSRNGNSAHDVAGLMPNGSPLGVPQPRLIEVPGGVQERRNNGRSGCHGLQYFFRQRNFANTID